MAVSRELSRDPDGYARITMTRPNDQSVLYMLMERDAVLDCSKGSPITDLHSVIQCHRAFKEDSRAGSAGFSFPSLGEHEVVEVTDEAAVYLATLGIIVSGSVGSSNKIIIAKGMAKIQLNIQFNQRTRNLVFLDKHSLIRNGRLNFQGDENIVVIGAGCENRYNGFLATFRYHAGGLFLGSKTSSHDTNYWIEGPDRSIQIGDGLLFSWGIYMRTSDGHGLIDLTKGKVINVPKSILIGPHVWLGHDVIVMPGARIGGGSVIGARSIVTKAVPAACVAVGAPARVVRRNVSWTMTSLPSPEMIAALQAENYTDV